MRSGFAVVLMLLAGALSAGLALAAGDPDPTDADKQAELDRRCEEARARKLAPIRDDIYRECLDKKQGDAAYCRRYADAYNGNRPGGAPRFYELPECEAAFDFRKSQRGGSGD